MLGTVTLLRRYPVKSMLGEDIGQSAEVTPIGLAGDRGHALIHTPTGRVVSAKNPRLWRAMLTLHAAGTDTVTITFPDDTTAASTDPGIDERLSDFLGQPVTLTATPPPDAQMEHADPDEVIRHGVAATVRTQLRPLGTGTFFNYAALHLITTSTLASTGADLIRYRPNAGQVIFHWTCYTILYECIFGGFYGFMIGYIARHLIKYSERKNLIDRESFLVFYFTLALFCAEKRTAWSRHCFIGHHVVQRRDLGQLTRSH